MMKIGLKLQLRVKTLLPPLLWTDAAFIDFTAAVTGPQYWISRFLLSAAAAVAPATCLPMNTRTLGGIVI